MKSQEQDNCDFEDSIIRPNIYTPCYSQSQHKQKNPLSIHSQTNNSSNYLNNQTYQGDNHSHNTLLIQDNAKIIQLDNRKQYQNKNSNIYSSMPKIGQIVEVFNARGSVLDARGSVLNARGPTTDQFINILQRQYYQCQLAFITVFGAKGTGKSLLCDTLINIAGAKGNHYFKNKQNGAYTWSIPFKRQNLVMFLIQINSPGEIAGNIQDSFIQKLIKFAGIWIVMDEQSLKQLQQLVIKTIKHYNIQNQPQKYLQLLPNNIYLVTNNENCNFRSDILPPIISYQFPSASNQQNSYTNKNNTELHQLPYISLDQNYLQTCFTLLKSISNNLQQRLLMNKVPLTSKIYIKLQPMIQLNKQSEAKYAVKQYSILKRVVSQAIAEQYQSNYYRSFAIYNKQIQKYFGYQFNANNDNNMNSSRAISNTVTVNKNPKDIFEMYDKLKMIAQTTLIRYGSYDTRFMDMQVRQKYYRILQTDIENLQSKFIENNKQITLQKLNQWFIVRKKGIKNQHQFLFSLQKQRPQLNHGRQEFIRKQLQQFNNLQNNQNLSESPQSGRWQQTYNNLKQSKLKVGQIQKQLQFERIQKLTSKIDRTKQQLDIISKQHRDNLNSNGISKLQNSVVIQQQLRKKRQQLTKQLLQLNIQLNNLSASRMSKDYTPYLHQSAGTFDARQQIVRIKDRQQEAQDKLIKMRSLEKSMARRKSRKKFCGLKF